VEGLTKGFERQGEARTIFEDVSLEIETRSFVTIVGPSGCGKSTLLQIIAGLQEPSAGAVRFKGTPVQGPPRGIVYIFQQYTKSIFPWLTVRQNVAFGLQHQPGVAKADAVDKARELIRLVGLERHEDYYPAQLSGGMQQRVALARGLAVEPEVLLMDEPFSAVDALTRTRLQELVLRIWETMGLTVLFVTHDVDEAVFLSSRVLVMRGPGGAPARFTRDVAIDVPYPRDPVETPANERFLAHRQTIFAEIFEGSAQQGGGR
jgi:NitT/TauT family transport system ATP-binding protein